jgi:5-methylcytosine-specific restriction endonuclease McrA
LWRALDDHEDHIFKEARTAGRREPHEAYAADALVALAEQSPRRPVELKVSADRSGLARGDVVPGERCEIDGFGPIPVTIARSLLNDARITVIGTDGTDVRTITSPTRNVPAKLRRMLEDAYPTCGNSRCASSFGLEIDHIIPVADGGPTTFENTWRLCKACHKLKHLFGWKVVGPPGHRDLVPPDHPEPAWVPDPPPGPGRLWESDDSDGALELVAPGPPP